MLVHRGEKVEDDIQALAHLEVLGYGRTGACQCCFQRQEKTFNPAAVMTSRRLPVRIECQAPGLGILSQVGTVEFSQRIRTQ